MFLTDCTQFGNRYGEYQFLYKPQVMCIILFIWYPLVQPKPTAILISHIIIQYHQSNIAQISFQSEMRAFKAERRPSEMLKNTQSSLKWTHRYEFTLHFYYKPMWRMCRMFCNTYTLNAVITNWHIPDPSFWNIYWCMNVCVCL